MPEKREVNIRGKSVTFSVDSKGNYYRDGKRTTGSYQKRVAKGILEGKTLAEARGHPFGKYSGKLLSRREINEQEEFHLGEWAEPPRATKRGQEKATYYMKVSVTAESVKKLNRPGSPTGEADGDGCVAITMRLYDPDNNNQTGFTYKHLARNFERIALFTISRYGHELCTGDLKRDLLNIWRHSRQ